MQRSSQAQASGSGRCVGWVSLDEDRSRSLHGGSKPEQIGIMLFHVYFNTGSDACRRWCSVLACLYQLSPTYTITCTPAPFQPRTFQSNECKHSNASKPRILHLKIINPVPIIDKITSDDTLIVRSQRQTRMGACNCSMQLNTCTRNKSYTFIKQTHTPNTQNNTQDEFPRTSRHS